MSSSTIIAKLNEIFADMDTKVLASTQEWAKGRAIVIGEDDGTYKNVPISEGYGLKSRTKQLEEIK